METKKTFLIRFVILIMTLLMFTSIFSQVRAGETLFLRGVIKSISKDLKSIVITNDVNIMVSADTKIFDRKGNPLKMGELKPELYVAIEALEIRDGFLAKKIMIKDREGG